MNHRRFHDLYLKRQENKKKKQAKNAIEKLNIVKVDSDTIENMPNANHTTTHTHTNLHSFISRLRIAKYHFPFSHSHTNNPNGREARKRKKP